MAAAETQAPGPIVPHGPGLAIAAAGAEAHPEDPHLAEEAWARVVFEALAAKCPTMVIGVGLQKTHTNN